MLLQFVQQCAHTGYGMLGGINWIDGLIILLLLAAAIGSVRIGFLTQACIIAAFFGALFLAGWIVPHILPAHDPTLKTALNINIVLISAGYAVVKGFELGRRLHWSFDKGKYGRIESTLGAIPAVTATLVIVWLLAAMLGRMPFVGLSNSVNDALIVQALTRELPPAPAVLATFNHQIDPNSPPTLFTEQPEPQASFAFSPSEFQAAAPKAAHSIVRVTGFGCGGQGSGSGFVVSKDLVLTNAHVVAGVERPIIKYNNHSFEAIPVVFDASQDIAVLRVIRQAHPFNAPPLPLTHTPAANNTTVAVLGYPGGNYAATPGIVRSNLPVRGNNIYGLGVVTRNTYDIQTSIWQGSSGSPIVLADGRVAGIIFAKYDAVNDYAIALASSHILPAVEQAETAYRRISTGSCLAG